MKSGTQDGVQTEGPTEFSALGVAAGALTWRLRALARITAGESVAAASRGGLRAAKAAGRAGAGVGAPWLGVRVKNRGGAVGGAARGEGGGRAAGRAVRPSVRPLARLTDSREVERASRRRKEEGQSQPPTWPPPRQGRPPRCSRLAAGGSQLESRRLRRRRAVGCTAAAAAARARASTRRPSTSCTPARCGWRACSRSRGCRTTPLTGAGRCGPGGWRAPASPASEPERARSRSPRRRWSLGLKWRQARGPEPAPGPGQLQIHNNERQGPGSQRALPRVPHRAPRIRP